MVEEICQPNPPAYREIAEATEKSGFTMPSDVFICSFLRTLVVTRPGSYLLELGT